MPVSPPPALIQSSLHHKIIAYTKNVGIKDLALSQLRESVPLLRLIKALGERSSGLVKGNMRMQNYGLQGDTVIVLKKKKAI